MESACDIAVESILDDMYVKCIRVGTDTISAGLVRAASEEN